MDAATGGARRVQRLPLSLDMEPYETATSLCSRISGRNGLPRMRVLCRDFSINSVALGNGEEEAVARVARLAGVEPAQLQLHTPTLIEVGRYRVGHETIKFSAMLRRGGQLCPLCIAEDECRDPKFGPYQRDIWQVAAFRHCQKHGVAFERPQFACRLGDIHDFTQVLKTWAPSAIIEVGTDGSALEEYLLSRIRTGAGADWIDRQAFHVVWQASEALGLLLKEGPQAKLHHQPTDKLIRAGAAGYEVLRKGLDALQVTLTDLRETGGQHMNNYGKLYGPLLSCLLERRRDPEFDEIRRFVRGYILQNFRIAPNTSVLGEQTEGNQMFTALTASRHFDVSLSMLNRQLKKEGLRPEGRPNEKSDPKLLVSRDRMEQVVAEVRKLSSITVTRAVIGADRHIMDRLWESGLLVPHYPDDGGTPVFHHDDIMQFLKRLQDAATAVRKPSRYWRPLTSAALKIHCSTVWLIEQALSGKLQLAARMSGPFQIADFLVSMNQLRALLSEVSEGMVTAAEAAKWLAADIPTIHALASSGLLPSQLAENRLANRPQRLFSKADLDAFAHSHVVMRALNGARRAKYTDTLAFIEQHGAQPVLSDPKVKPIFKRQHLEHIASLEGGRAAVMAFVD
ncbi:TniQ family protein [Thioclava sp. GXIMD4216]|uniref:TniQ family protein n=1 Tax=Thioclava sp. GXIMD4216 TaxID=3131929 RepID=UPI0030CD8293